MLPINHYGWHIELLRLNKKYLYWKKFQESKLHADYVTYKKYQNKAVAEIRKAKKSFEKKLSVNIKSDPKSFYAYVHSKSKTKTKVGPLIDYRFPKHASGGRRTNVHNSKSVF